MELVCKGDNSVAHKKSGFLVAAAAVFDERLVCKCTFESILKLGTDIVIAGFGIEDCVLYGYELADFLYGINLLCKTDFHKDNHMFTGISLFYGRGQYTLFYIVVYH